MSMKRTLIWLTGNKLDLSLLPKQETFQPSVSAMADAATEVEIEGTITDEGMAELATALDTSHTIHLDVGEHHWRFVGVAGPFLRSLAERRSGGDPMPLFDLLSTHVGGHPDRRAEYRKDGDDWGAWPHSLADGGGA